MVTYKHGLGHLNFNKAKDLNNSCNNSNNSYDERVSQEVGRKKRKKKKVSVGGVQSGGGGVTTRVLGFGFGVWHLPPGVIPNNFCFHVYSQKSCFGMTWHGLGLGFGILMHDYHDLKILGTGENFRSG